MMKSHNSMRRFADGQTQKWEREQWRTFVLRMLRWAIGVPLLFTYPRFLMGPFLVLLGLALIVPDIVHCFVEWIFRRRMGILKPVYGIPESLVAKGLYAEAEQEYEKIIQAYPDEVKPHIDMINIAVTRLHDGGLARQLYERGLASLKRPEARETLTGMFTTIMTRLKPQQNHGSGSEG